MFGEDNIDLALEEAWVYRTIKDFEHILRSDKYSHIDFNTLISNDTKKQLLVMFKERYGE